MYKALIKPLVDWGIAFCALIILIPIFIVVIIAIKIDSPGPVFFIQNRLGRDGRVFKIIKFRSMRQDFYAREGNKLYENDQRITRVGRFIRKTSIDEIPQILNILRGEMSFIGPRPPITTFPKRFEEYTEFEKQRFNVKPGISGLAAVRCREIHDWDINIPIDVEYVNNISFKNDAWLFMLSLTAFLKTDNIYRKKE
jgi:lipopolysaccharide/colanic/teichoic acid biosynthesis glycosyltransferase